MTLYESDGTQWLPIVSGGGGGGITDIVSPDGSIVITNQFGPVVSMVAAARIDWAELKTNTGNTSITAGSTSRLEVAVNYDPNSILTVVTSDETKFSDPFARFYLCVGTFHVSDGPPADTTGTVAWCSVQQSSGGGSAPPSFSPQGVELALDNTTGLRQAQFTLMGNFGGGAWICPIVTNGGSATHEFQVDLWIAKLLIQAE